MKLENLRIRSDQPQAWERPTEIHDSARKIELKLAGLDGAFLPLSEAAHREGLFDYTVCVAEADGTVVGFAAYSEEELAWLYVDPARMRGGIGRALAQYALQQIGASPMSVEVLAGNEPALRLYESLGFGAIEICSGVMPGNEAFPVTVYRMRRLPAVTQTQSLEI